MLPQYFVYIAALIELSSTAIYAWAMFKGDVCPNRVTWFMWALTPLIAAMAQAAAGVGLSTLVVFMSGFGPLLIFIAAVLYKDAYWEMTVFDYVCGALALCGLACWWITKNESFAIIFSMAADFFGTLPTLRKAWYDPQSENGPTYVLDFIGAIIGIFCVRQHTFAGYAFTVFIAFICALLSVFIYRRRLAGWLQGRIRS